MLGDEHYRLIIDHPLAEIMEYGTVDQPARPFVRPAIAELEPQVEKLYEMGGTDKVLAKFKELLKKHLAKYGKQDIAESISFEVRDDV